MWEDKIIDHVKFKKPLTNVDINDYLEKDNIYEEKNRNVRIFLNIDYSKEVIIYSFVDAMDIVSKLGGYKGAFEPFLMYFFPMIILSFLINYSSTISGIYKVNYKDQLEKSVRALYDQIKKVPKLDIKLDHNDKRDQHD